MNWNNQKVDAVNVQIRNVKRNHKKKKKKEEEITNNKEEGKGDGYNNNDKKDKGKVEEDNNNNMKDEGNEQGKKQQQLPDDKMDNNSNNKEEQVEKEVENERYNPKLDNCDKVCPETTMSGEVNHNKQQHGRHWQEVEDSGGGGDASDHKEGLCSGEEKNYAEPAWVNDVYKGTKFVNLMTITILHLNLMILKMLIKVVTTKVQMKKRVPKVWW